MKTINPGTLCAFLFIFACQTLSAQIIRNVWSVESFGSFETPGSMDVCQYDGGIAYVVSQRRSFYVVINGPTASTSGYNLFPAPSAGSIVPHGLCYSQYSGTPGVFVLAALPSRSGAERQDCLLIKFNLNGTIAWQDTITQSGFNLYPEALESTSTGDVLIVYTAVSAIDDQSRMMVRKYRPDSDRRVWEQPYSYDRGVTMARRLVVSGDHFYVTGVVHRMPLLGGYRPDRMPTARLFLLKGNLSSGLPAWERFIDRGSLNCSGYDLYVTNDGVTVLGQERDRTSADIVIVTYNSDSTRRWIKRLPTKVRAHEDLYRRQLAGSITGDIYVAYVPPSEAGISEARLVKFDYDGNELFDKSSGFPGYVEVQALNFNVLNGTLSAGVQHGRPGVGARYTNQIALYAANGNYITASAPTAGNSIKRIVTHERSIAGLPDAQKYIYSMSNVYRVNTGDARNTYSIRRQYYFVPLPFPFPLENVENFESSHSARANWFLENLCEISPCNFATMEASEEQNGQQIWSTVFDTSVAIPLQPASTPPSYHVALKGGQRFLTYDKSLYTSSIKDISISTNLKSRELTIRSTTNGKNVPFTVQWLNVHGKLLHQKTFNAPSEIQFTKTFSETVGRLIILARGGQNFSYYPNPSNGQFTLLLDEAGFVPAQVAILSTDGTLVYSGRFNSSGEFLISVPQKKGLYVMLVKTENGEKRELIEIR